MSSDRAVGTAFCATMKSDIQFNDAFFAAVPLAPWKIDSQHERRYCLDAMILLYM